LIASIHGATIENEEKMEPAYLRYWSLSEEERNKVTGYDVLQTLRSELTKAYVVKEYADTRIPHERLLLGVYLGPPNATEQTVKELADAHLDMIWHAYYTETQDSEGNPVTSWELLEKYGLGMFNQTAFIQDANGQLRDAPNLWLVEGRDEPSQNDFDTLAALGHQLRESHPECGYTNNLFPNYASREQLGVSLYDIYLMNFAQKMPTDIICYDHYPYTASVRNATHLQKWLNNLTSVRDVCMDYGKDMYIIIQSANDDMTNGYITADQMRFQAYSAMTFGAKSISWFLYYNAVWTGAIYDNGVRTEQYEKMVEVNAELKAFEPIYMRYTTSNVGYLLNKPVRDEVPTETYDVLSKLRQTGIKKIDKTIVTDFAVEGTDVIQVGQFTKNVGEGSALMLLNITDYTYETKTTAKVTFTVVDHTSVVTAYVKGIPTVLDPDENGVYTVEVSGADPVFLTVD
jgi:ssDNA-specific exonuclease RecJ